MMLMVPCLTGVPAEAREGASGFFCFESPSAPRLGSALGRFGAPRSSLTVEPATLCPITMPRRIEAMPGTSTL